MILSVLKRIMSPGESKDGGVRRGSKKDMSVWPMVFQPLGPAESDTPVCAQPIDTAPPGTPRIGT